MASTADALTALDEGRIDDAHSELLTVVQVTPSDARAWKILADLHRRQAVWDECLAALDQVRRHTRGASEAVTAWMLTAEVYDRHQQQPREAIAAWERVLQIDDTQTAAWLALSELHLRQHKWSAAIGNAQHGLQFGKTTDQDQGWLYLCIALGKRNVASSTGPTSTFFNRLGSNHTGDRALIQAFTAWPRLIELVGDDPLTDSFQTIAILRGHLPWPKPPSWWAR